MSLLADFKSPQVSRTVLAFLPNTAIAIVLSYLSFTLFPKSNNLIVAMNILAAAIIIMPFMLTRYVAYKKKKDAEDKFPTFLRDFVETIRGGLTVPAAFILVSKNDYGALSPYVQKIAAQLEWGIPVDKVLMSFAKSTGSQLITRIVSSVIESHRFGGKLAETFDALSHTAVEVDRLKTERKFFLQSQMMTGYIIFFVFLGVIISLQQFLVPALTEKGATALAQQKLDPKVIAEGFNGIFRDLILIQGMFAGIAVGKMTEGALIAGLKHSMIMMLVGGLAFFLSQTIKIF